MDITPKLINSIGLIFDILGAWLIGWEIVYQFKTPKFETQPLKANGEIPPPKLSEKYTKWVIMKYKFMFCGLIFLTIGFGFQIYSNYFPIRSQNKSIINELKQNKLTIPAIINPLEENISPNAKSITDKNSMNRKK